MTMDRVVIFTANLSAYSVRKGLGELLGRFPTTKWLIIEHRPPRQWGRVARNQIRQLRRDGWRWFPSIASSAMQEIRTRFHHHDEAAAELPGQEYELAKLLRHPHVSFMQVSDIHASTTIATVRQFNPDVGISLAAPILRPELFEIPRLGTINLHKGTLPDYRGMPPAFWEIWNGSREVGCTVHRVEAKLDTGPILVKLTTPVERFSTVRGLQIRLDEAGVELVAEALDRLTQGTAKPETQQGTGTLYRKPTPAQWAAIRKREPGRLGSSWLSAAKEAVFLLYVSCVRPLPRLVLGLLGRQRITVLLYHRVCDNMRDSLTVGLEQFERQMNDIKRRCRVVSIEEIVTGTVSRRSLRPIVAVTFDDGYLDNFENAAPILLRCRVPAAFYVCTGLVNTDRGLPHDLANLGRAIPVMTWKHVTRLKHWMFSVGSHSRTHVNCAKDDPAFVDSEITESRRELEATVGSRDLIFAYPYGGRGDFNDHWRARVRQAGYIGCLSAYGGSIRGAINPFNVVRTAISYAFGKWAFRARLEGWG